MKFFKKGLVFLIITLVVSLVGCKAESENIALQVQNKPIEVIKTEELPKESAEKEAPQDTKPVENQEIPEESKPSETEKPVFDEEKLTEVNPLQSETESEKAADYFECILLISCGNALGKTDGITLPENGIIFEEQAAVVYPGESVFNLLVREMKKNKIHLEFSYIPLYNSAYIEGINNLYEFDCGELSGWMYKVNGVFPDFGCSGYVLNPGDKIEWVYTCDLGKDVGGEYSKKNGMKNE